MSETKQQLLKNRYRLLRLIGQGGMGQVFQAYDEHKHKTVAIKVMIASDEIDQKRFYQEFQFLGHITHPYLVKAYDFFTHAQRACIVLEYVQGELLKNSLQQGLGLSLPEKIILISRILRAVESLHQQSIIHRDIKPSNIIIDLANGNVKLMDLGVAKTAHQGGQKLTKSGQAVGTAEYMSPEQVSGEPTLQSDLFSLGVVFYQLFLEKKTSPFHGQNFYETALNISEISLVQEIQEWQKNYSSELATSVGNIIIQLLEKDISHRTPNIQKAIDDFKRAYDLLTPNEIRNLNPNWRNFAQHVKYTPPTATQVNTPIFAFEEKKQFGPYQIIEKIGQGGMGTVYKAQQENVERTVALKVIHSTTETKQKRFLREAQVGAQLQHPNIIPVYSTGNEERYTYIAMRYIEGETFANWQQHVSEKEKLEAIVKIVDALAHAHEEGITHRDVKPSNIIVDKDHQPYLGDFGLAKIQKNYDLTSEGTSLGTLLYMSPEQIQGKRVLPKSDIYSIGVILYESATKRLPFLEEEPTKLYKKVTNADFPPPCEVSPDIAQDLEFIILKAMSSKTPKRYRSAKELKHDLLDYLQGKKIRSKKSRKNNLGIATAIILAFLSIGYFFLNKQTPKANPTKNLTAKEYFAQAGEASSSNFQRNLMEVSRLESKRYRSKFLAPKYTQRSIEKLIAADYCEDALVAINYWKKTSYEQALKQHKIFATLAQGEYFQAEELIAEQAETNNSSENILFSRIHYHNFNYIRAQQLWQRADLGLLTPEEIFNHAFLEIVFSWHNIQKSLNSLAHLRPELESLGDAERSREKIQQTLTTIRQLSTKLEELCDKNFRSKRHQDLEFCKLLFEMESWAQQDFTKEDALTLLKKYQNRSPADQLLLSRSLFRYFLKQEHWQQAYELGSTLEEMYPWDFYVRQMQGYSLFYLNNYSLAKRKIQESIGLDRFNLSGANDIAKLFMQDFNQEQMIHCLDLISKSLTVITKNRTHVFFRKQWQKLYTRYAFTRKPNYSPQDFTRYMDFVIKNQSKDLSGIIAEIIRYYPLKDIQESLKKRDVQANSRLYQEFIRQYILKQRKEIRKVLLRFCALEETKFVIQALKINEEVCRTSPSIECFLKQIVSDEQEDPMIRFLAARIMVAAANYEFIRHLQQLETAKFPSNVIAMAALQERKFIPPKLNFENITPELRQTQNQFYLFLVAMYYPIHYLNKNSIDYIVNHDSQQIRLATISNILRHDEFPKTVSKHLIYQRIRELLSDKNWQVKAFAICWNFTDFPYRSFPNYSERKRAQAERYSLLWNLYQDKIVEGLKSSNNDLYFASLASLLVDNNVINRFCITIQNTNDTKNLEIKRKMEDLLIKTINQKQVDPTKRLASIFALGNVAKEESTWKIISNPEGSFSDRSAAFISYVDSLSERKNIASIRRIFKFVHEIQKQQTKSSRQLERMVIFYIGVFTSSRAFRNIPGYSIFVNFQENFFRKLEKKIPQQKNLHNSYIGSLLWLGKMKDISKIKKLINKNDSQRKKEAAFASIFGIIARHDLSNIEKWKEKIRIPKKYRKYAAWGCYQQMLSDFSIIESTDTVHKARDDFYYEYLKELQKSKQKETWEKYLMACHILDTENPKYPIELINIYLITNVKKAHTYLKILRKMMRKEKNQTPEYLAELALYDMCLSNNEKLLEHQAHQVLLHHPHRQFPQETIAQTFLMRGLYTSAHKYYLSCLIFYPLKANHRFYYARAIRPLLANHEWDNGAFFIKEYNKYLQEGSTGETIIYRFHSELRQHPNKAEFIRKIRGN